MKEAKNISNELRHKASLRKPKDFKKCIPCAKSHQVCDHGEPCSRCVRLDQADECILGPVPKAKNRKVAPKAKNNVPKTVEPEPKVTGSKEIALQIAYRECEGDLYDQSHHQVEVAANGMASKEDKSPGHTSVDMRSDRATVVAVDRINNRYGPSPPAGSKRKAEGLDQTEVYEPRKRAREDVFSHDPRRGGDVPVVRQRNNAARQ